MSSNEKKAAWLRIFTATLPGVLGQNSWALDGKVFHARLMVAQAFADQAVSKYEQTAELYERLERVEVDSHSK